MIYEKIKNLAKDKGVSINQVEKDLKFSTSTISKWNNSNPTSEKLNQVATYFGVTMESLLKEDKVKV